MKSTIRAAAVCLALGMTFGLAACGGEGLTTPQQPHSHTFSAQWSHDETNHWHDATCGHDAKSGVAAHEFGDDDVCDICNYRREGGEEPGPGGPGGEEPGPGGDEPTQPQYQTGDTVTDEASREKINASLRASFEGVSAAFAADFDVDVAPQTEQYQQYAFAEKGKATGKAAVGLGETKNADVFATVQRESEADCYLLAFLRGEEAYGDYAEWPADVAEGDYAALLATYAGEDGPALYYGSASDAQDVAPWADTFGTALPIVGKLLKNGLVYSEAPIIKTETGYAMSVDLSEILDKMLGAVQKGFEDLKKTSALGAYGLNTLGTLLKQESIDEMLQTMLYGITAQELIDLAGYIHGLDFSALPGGLSAYLQKINDLDLDAFPTPSSPDMGAYDYLWQCLASKDLLIALADALIEDFPDAKETLEPFLSNGAEAVPLSFIWTVAKQEFDRDLIVETIQSWRTSLSDNFVKTLFGETAEGECSFTVKATFNEEFTLTALDLAFDIRGLAMTAEIKDESGAVVVTADVALDANGTIDLILTASAPTMSDLTGLNTRTDLPPIPSLPSQEDPSETPSEDPAA